MPRTMENSNTRLLLSEILRKVSNAKTKKEKVDLLRKYNSNALRQMLIINFDDSIISVMPEGNVELFRCLYLQRNKQESASGNKST